MENIFAIFCTLQTNQIYQNRIRRIKERLDFPKISPFRLYTHNSGLDSASCFNSSEWYWNKCENACSRVGKGHWNIYSFSKYLDAHQGPGILLRPIDTAENLRNLHSKRFCVPCYSSLLSCLTFSSLIFIWFCCFFLYHCS